MNRILYILPLLLLVFSCKEDTLDVYTGDNYVHFTPIVSDNPVVEFNFAYDGETTRETEFKVPVEIRLWGYLPEKDFKCKVVVVDEKTTAPVSSFDISSETVFRKGFHVDTLWVNVKRNEKLLKTNYTIALRLEGADDNHIVGPAKYDTAIINVIDKIHIPPVWWATTPELGEYSDIKYRMFNFYLGKVLQNLDDYTSITFKEEALAFKNWWKEEWEKGNHIYYSSDGVTPLYETIPE